MLNLIWLDLETTGLDPQKDRVLEIFAVAAPIDMPFNLSHASYHRILQHPGPFAPFQDVDPFVINMHTKNGLWDDCQHSKAAPFEVDDELCELFPEAKLREDLYVLAGSSVHFDLNFVRKWFPKFAARCSHRVYDVSAVGLFARSMGMDRLPKAEAHRAEADVMESIANAKKMQDFFRNLGHRGF